MNRIVPARDGADDQSRGHSPLLLYVAVAALAACLWGCGAPPPRPAPEAQPPAAIAPLPAAGEKKAVVTKKGGGFYLDDGPLETTIDLAAIPDAVPRLEPLHRFANRPYSVFGRDYRPLPANAPYRAEGIASWYGRRYHGQLTSSGERYDMFAMTAAHPTLPIPSYARVTNPANGRQVVVRINDRGPFLHERLIDLSYAAAWKLGLISDGSGRVVVERIFPSETPPLPSPAPPAAAVSETTDTVIEDRLETGGHWLQLGAFGSRENAEALRAKLALALGELGEKLTVKPVASLYKLQLGPWRDAAEARRVAETLKSVFDLPSIVVR